MAQEEFTETTTEYTEYIEGERSWLAQNRSEYEKVKGILTERAFEILQQLSLKISQCNADSPSEKSHYAMGQCRQILADRGRELGLTEKFEKAEKRVKKFDLDEAQRAK